VLQLLHHNTPGGIGGKELSAPQAGLFASLAEGFFGDGQLPWDMVAIGAGVGVVMVIVDAILEKKGSSFRAHVMPIAVGMYLPFELAPPILAGGLIAHFLSRGEKTDEGKEEKLRRGVLFASGTIAGEALMGVGLAILASVGVARLNVELDPIVTNLITGVVLVTVLGLFWTQSKQKGVSE